MLSVAILLVLCANVFGVPDGCDVGEECDDVVMLQVARAQPRPHVDEAEEEADEDMDDADTAVETLGEVNPDHAEAKAKRGTSGMKVIEWGDKQSRLASQKASLEEITKDTIPLQADPEVEAAEKAAQEAADEASEKAKEESHKAANDMAAAKKAADAAFADEADINAMMNAADKAIKAHAGEAAAEEQSGEKAAQKVTKEAAANEKVVNTTKKNATLVADKGPDKAEKKAEKKEGQQTSDEAEKKKAEKGPDEVQDKSAKADQALEAAKKATAAQKASDEAAADEEADQKAAEKATNEAQKKAAEKATDEGQKKAAEQAADKAAGKNASAAPAAVPDKFAKADQVLEAAKKALRDMSNGVRDPKDAAAVAQGAAAKAGQDNSTAAAAKAKIADLKKTISQLTNDIKTAQDTLDAAQGGAGQPAQASPVAQEAAAEAAVKDAVQSPVVQPAVAPVPAPPPPPPLSPFEQAEQQRRFEEASNAQRTERMRKRMSHKAQKQLFGQGRDIVHPGALHVPQSGGFQIPPSTATQPNLQVGSKAFRKRAAKKMQADAWAHAAAEAKYQKRPVPFSEVTIPQANGAQVRRNRKHKQNLASGGSAPEALPKQEAPLPTFTKPSKKRKNSLKVEADAFARALSANQRGR
eukprot:gnl/TRDRNA2_/TRDRNA2_151729_c0_seq1.p1 gnl/TRDRNA2_/TRDRNA2_151729_c0~~gnl/TRDRNA2_/TRDRNA2_151729_c0_seq1.p1  ORF type:complete len:641 (-),score=217.92 gnl/TRDRNA2_/TRDRNA2_151729_c0_seq1:95-2017(-)